MAFYRHQLFPRFYDSLMRLGSLDSRRARHLDKASGEVLEVGIGTGLNLKYYPEEVSSITGLDSNPGMLVQLRKRQGKIGPRVEPVLSSAENMPFGDNLFDTVVSTHSLCSMVDRHAALIEISRVLKPGGQLLFLEHGLSPDQKIAKWQRRLNGIQKRFAVGCVLDMAVDVELREAGFEIVELEKGYQPRESKTHGYLYEGRAVNSVSGKVD